MAIESADEQKRLDTKGVSCNPNMIIGIDCTPFVNGVLTLFEQHGEGMVLPKRKDEIMTEMKKGKTILALDGMKVVGHQTFYIWPDRLCIEPRGGVVRKDYRGQGLGTKLREKVLSIITKNYPKYTVVAVASIKSQGIWKKLGFTDAQEGDILPDLLLDCDSCPLQSEALVNGDSCCHKMLVYRKET